MIDVIGLGRSPSIYRAALEGLSSHPAPVTHQLPGSFYFRHEDYLMPCFVRLEDSAMALATTVSALEELARWGWITIVEKDRRRYLHGHHQVRAQFVLDLRCRLHLEPGQVAALLAREKPPFSSKKVLEIIESLRMREPGRRGKWE